MIDHHDESSINTRDDRLCGDDGLDREDRKRKAPTRTSTHRVLFGWI
jgi:hypothetical protein